MVDPDSSAPYVLSPGDHVLQDMDRSVVVFGRPGSGKQTAFEQMLARCADRVLLVPWQAGPVAVAPTPQVAVYVAVRSAVAQAFVNVIRTQTSKLASLSVDGREFLHWLLAVSYEPRRLRTLARVIPELDLLLGTPPEDLYTDFSADSIGFQVDEMVLLAQELGYERIVIHCHVDGVLPPSACEPLQLLFAWRALWEQRGFLLKAALPQNIVEEYDLMRYARGRVSFLRMEWELHQCVAVADAWASHGSPQPVALAALLEPPLFDSIVAILEDIDGEHLPAGWKLVGELVRNLYLERRRKLLLNSEGSWLRRRLYHRLAPLIIEPDRSGVRRGSRYIRLSGQPLRVLEVLLRYHSDETRAALLEITTTENNMYRQIKNLRDAIEPLPHHAGEWVYVCNAGNGNYVVEGSTVS